MNQSADHQLGLVLSGGGILGIAHIGMLAALEEHHLLDDIDVAVGTSAGAIMAAMFALGYTPAAMMDIWQRDAWSLFGGKVDPNAVQDRNWKGAFDALIHWDWTRFRGLILGEKLSLALRTYMVSSKPGIGPTRQTCPLYVLATNYNTSQQTVWRFTSHVSGARDLGGPVEEEAFKPAEGRVAQWQIYEEDDTTTTPPKITQFPSIAQAVRCSISIPFVFVPAQAPTLRAGQTGPDETIYVDGGVRDNYSLSAAVKLAHCDRVFGLMLGSTTPYAPQGWTGLAAMAQRVINQMGQTIFEADQDDGVLRSTDIRTLVPRLPGTGGTFDVAAIPAIYQAGLEVTQEFLQRVGAQNNGTVTWDTIFDTTHLPPSAGDSRSLLRPATPAPTADVVKYYIYEKAPPGPA